MTRSPHLPPGRGRAPVPSAHRQDDLGFADALASALQQRGMSLQRVAHHLRLAGRPVSVATLSYWQTGRSQPSRPGSEATVEALEKILMTPPGYLVGPLARLRGEQWDPRGAIPGEFDLAELRRIGLDLDRRLALLALHQTVDPNRHAPTVTTRLLVRSHHAGLRRFPLILPTVAAAGAVRGSRPRALALLGCRVEPLVPVARDEAGATAWALPVQLPRSLAPGELAALEVRSAWRAQRGAPTRLAQPLLEPVRLLTMATVRHDDGQRTITARHHRVADGQATSSVTVNGWQYTVEDAPAGLHSIDWEP